MTYNGGYTEWEGVTYRDCNAGGNATHGNTSFLTQCMGKCIDICANQCGNSDKCKSQCQLTCINFV